MIVLWRVVPIPFSNFGTSEEYAFCEFCRELILSKYEITYKTSATTDIGREAINGLCGGRKWNVNLIIGIEEDIQLIR